MAFDGLTISCITHNLSDKLVNGRLVKIAQPENDELILTIKNNKEQYRVLISANPSLPLIYISNTNKPSPLTAPGFCMLLRKHINNGRILSITQPSLERIINFEIEHLNEMGDLCRKYLIVELMGKHSNIIFCDENNKIIDSIKHISFQMSSVREVLPGREYFVPQTMNKLNPLDITFEDFKDIILSKNIPLSKALYSSLTGISPVVSEDILLTAGFDSNYPTNDLSEGELYHLYKIFTNYIDNIKNRNFCPIIYYNSSKEPVDYSVVKSNVYSDCLASPQENINILLEKFYAEKNLFSRMRQRSTDLRQIVSSALSKSIKKLDLQEKQLKDTDKREKYKVYGELITTYGYSLSAEDKVLKCINYYDNNEVSIPIDNTFTPIENAKKYFDKYSKLKRTYEALSEIIPETRNEVKHLESISNSLDIATNEDDLKEIKEELIQFGYIKRKSSDKKSKFVSKPMHLQLDNGFEIYIGKNNFQNDEITFKIATGNDWWFHSKTFPGSHVIVKCNNNELPDEMYEIAGSLAAFYSKGKEQEKVEIDYTQKKNLKRVAGAAPGFVIYHTNYSMMSNPKSLDEIKELLKLTTTL
ncbi:MAG: NFACT family protein [Lachnospiraceae bacterium]|nr:NFACT family protein [Lachnospiraceae bacterium]